jgi:anti-sigma factor RsiW
MKHLDDTQLNDYADGVMDAGEAERARRHIGACESCAREVRELAALKASIGELPRDIRPDRDLREGIWNEIAEPRHTRTLWSMRYPLAAAAILLIAVTSVVTRALVTGPAESEVGADYNSAARLASDDARKLEREYSEEVQELEMVLRKSRGALAPETVRIMEENLRIIDRAINEAQAALASDPNSDMLVDLLRSAYERKLELLRQAARSSPVT